MTTTILLLINLSILIIIFAKMEKKEVAKSATVDKLKPKIEYGNTEKPVDKLEDKLEDKLVVKDQHKRILEKVSAGTEIITASFRVSTNDMVLRKGQYSVVLEYSEEDKPICYTVIKGETTKDVIYMDQVDKWLANKTQAKLEEKQKTNSVQKSVKYYRDKVDHYIKLKESTMRSDKSILQEIGLTKMSLNTYGKEHDEKIKALRAECRRRHIEKVKKARL